MYPFKRILWLGMMFIFYMMSLITVLVNAALSVFAILSPMPMVTRVIVIWAMTVSAVACVHLADKILTTPEPNFD